MEDPLSINSNEMPCRICEVVLSVLLIVPIATFSVFSFTKPDAGYWGLLSIIVGLPLAYVSIRILFLSERSRRIGLLPPWALYAFGLLCVVSPFISQNPAWASIGIGLLFLHAARQRQITRNNIRGESYEK